MSRSARDDSPDSVGYIQEDHPLRVDMAAQSVRLLQVPPSRDEENILSFTTSFTDMDVPIFSRDPHGYRRAKRGGINSRLLFAIVAAALGSAFQHGYNTGVVNAPEKLISQWIKDILVNKSIEHGETYYQNLEDWKTFILSTVVSIFCVGGMVGGLLIDVVSEYYGRKGGLLLNNVLVLVAAAFMGLSRFAGSFYMLIIGRFVIGVNCGLNVGLAPMYLAEISPIHLRGAIGTVYQLVVTISILVSQILGMQEILGTDEHWPILFSLILIPAIFQVLTMPLCPESPKYLASKGQDLHAEKALTWLRGTIEVHDEMDEMKGEIESQKSAEQLKLRDIFGNRMLRIPLLISIGIMLAQQLSGINAIMYFSTRIFYDARLNTSEAQKATLGMGAMNVLMTVVSLFLVERAGRKTLLLIGFLGLFVSTVLLGITLMFEGVLASYLCIFLVIMYVVMFAVGPGSIPWFLVSELNSQAARPLVISISIAINWAANFIVGLGFIPLSNAIGGNIFFVFAVLQLAFTVFIYQKVPETKNKNIEEISALFRQISYQ